MEIKQEQEKPKLKVRFKRRPSPETPDPKQVKPGTKPAPKRTVAKPAKEPAIPGKPRKPAGRPARKPGRYTGKFSPRKPLPEVVEGKSGEIRTVGPASKKERSRVSPELLDMLAKLSTWEPKSDSAVLEAATRLAQAAREKIDYPKEEPVDVLDSAMWACSGLAGRVLTRDNGVSLEYDYVTVVTRDDPGNAVELSTVHLFHRDRLGEMAVSVRTIKVPAARVIVEDPSVSGKVRRKKPVCPVPGYDVDTEAFPLKPVIVAELEKLCDGLTCLIGRAGQDTTCAK